MVRLEGDGVVTGDPWLDMGSPSEWVWCEILDLVDDAESTAAVAIAASSIVPL